MNFLTFWVICGSLTLLIMLNDVRKSALTITEVLDDYAGYIVLLFFFLSGPLGLLVILVMKLLGK